MAQMLAGENALQVATRLRAAVGDLQESLPRGITIVTYYEPGRSSSGASSERSRRISWKVALS